MITRHERCTACHGTESANAHIHAKRVAGKGLLKMPRASCEAKEYPRRQYWTMHSPQR